MCDGEREREKKERERDHGYYANFLGESWQTKISNVREKLKEKDCTVLVLTALDEIACKDTNYYHYHMTITLYLGLFNLRGSDIEFNPVFFAYSIVTLDSVR